METMTFKVKGFEKKDYELSNREIVDLIKSKDTTDAEREFLKNKVVSRFENDLCPNAGETNDDVFVRLFSEFVNGKMRDKKHVAERMSKDHRYLQSEMFKLCLEYIKILAENADKGYYDPRNEWACKTSKLMIDHLKSIDWYI